MSRTILAIRHGKPELPSEHDDILGPHLTREAKNDIINLRANEPRFAQGIGIMAVSSTWRSMETAELLGATTLLPKSVLRELTPSLPVEELRAMAAAHRAPREFIDAGLDVLARLTEATDKCVVHGWNGMGILGAVEEVGGTHDAPSLLVPNLGIVEFTF